MGISGLLPLLSSTFEKTHISKYAHQKVAIDMYAWLHRGSYTCGAELCLNIETSKHVDYCMNLVNMLRRNNVVPVCVFDGAKLPAKLQTENKRKAARTSHLQKAVEVLKRGEAKHEVVKMLQKAVDITPDISQQLVRRLQAEGIEYVVAPYEADAQLAYLSLQRTVACVISEDSDLIPFGCQVVLYKMDNNGHGLEFDSRRIIEAKELDLKKFNLQMLRHMCILSGCDYLPSIPGIGIKNAWSLINRMGELSKAVRRVRFDGRLRVPRDYEVKASEAELTFLYQRVWDSQTRQIVHLNPIPQELRLPDDVGFLGPVLDAECAQGICEAKLHPDTHQPFGDSPASADTQGLIQECKQLYLTSRNKAQRAIKSRPDNGQSYHSHTSQVIVKQSNTLMTYFTNGASEKKTSILCPSSKATLGTTDPVSNSSPSSHVQHFKSASSYTADLPSERTSESAKRVSRFFVTVSPPSISTPPNLSDFRIDGASNPRKEDAQPSPLIESSLHTSLVANQTLDGSADDHSSQGLSVHGVSKHLEIGDELSSSATNEQKYDGHFAPAWGLQTNAEGKSLNLPISSTHPSDESTTPATHRGNTLPSSAPEIAFSKDSSPASAAGASQLPRYLFSRSADLRDRDVETSKVTRSHGNPADHMPRESSKLSMLDQVKLDQIQLQSIALFVMNICNVTYYYTKRASHSHL